MKPRTHTFNGVKYNIQYANYIGGITDIGEKGYHLITLVDGTTINTLDNALHEALHAIGIPDKALHHADGIAKTDDIARFLWRLGWRRVYNKP